MELATVESHKVLADAVNYCTHFFSSLITCYCSQSMGGQFYLQFCLLTSYDDKSTVYSLHQDQLPRSLPFPHYFSYLSMVLNFVFSIIGHEAHAFHLSHSKILGLIGTTCLQSSGDMSHPLVFASPIIVHEQIPLHVNFLANFHQKTYFEQTFSQHSKNFEFPVCTSVVLFLESHQVFEAKVSSAILQG